MQLYAPRWQDSENGSRYCVVIRLTPGVEDVPLSTMNDVLGRIYKDCDDAALLYNESTAKRSKSWEPGVEVAYGIKARAALLREDWATAQDMAHKARSGYSIMTPDEFKAWLALPQASGCGMPTEVTSVTHASARCMPATALIPAYGAMARVQSTMNYTVSSRLVISAATSSSPRISLSAQP